MQGLDSVSSALGTSTRSTIYLEKAVVHLFSFVCHFLLIGMLHCLLQLRAVLTFTNLVKERAVSTKLNPTVKAPLMCSVTKKQPVEVGS